MLILSHSHSSSFTHTHLLMLILFLIFILSHSYSSSHSHSYFIIHIHPLSFTLILSHSPSSSLAHSSSLIHTHPLELILILSLVFILSHSSTLASLIRIELRIIFNHHTSSLYFTHSHPLSKNENQVHKPSSHEFFIFHSQSSSFKKRESSSQTCRKQEHFARSNTQIFLVSFFLFVDGKRSTPHSVATNFRTLQCEEFRTNVDFRGEG